MIKKRFIAGAVCPRCGEMDRLVTFEEDGKSVKECVSCGFSEKQLAQVEMKELDTRVNQHEKPSDAIEPINLMLDSGAKKKS